MARKTPTMIEGDKVRDHVSKEAKAVREHTVVAVREAVQSEHDGMVSKLTAAHKQTRDELQSGITDHVYKTFHDLKDRTDKAFRDIADRNAALDRKVDAVLGEIERSALSPVWVSLGLATAFVLGAWIF